MAPYNLVIIDMQTHFTAAFHEPTVAKIAKEIRKAKRVGAAIIVVELVNCGPTTPEIDSIIGSYKKTVFVEKTDTGGGSEISEAVRNSNFLNRTKFKITGVYTDVCVSDTVNQLTQVEDLEVEVIAEGCWAGNIPAYPYNPRMYTDGEYDYFKKIRPRENVSIVF